MNEITLSPGFPDSGLSTFNSLPKTMADEITYINIEKLLEEHIEELQQMRGMIVQMALKTFGQENASINNKAKEMVASINQLKTI